MTNDPIVTQETEKPAAIRDLAIEYRPVEALIPYSRNPRTHTEDQIGQVMASIREFGFTNPILLDGRNGIIAGHCRLIAAKRLGFKTVPCIELAHMTEAQRRAYVIADNKLAENAGWDEDLLRYELADLSKMGMDIQLLGFSEEELNDLINPAGTEGLTDEDEVPAPPPIPTSRAGDIWILGRHRLACGDATAPAQCQALMNGQQADMVFTDPPYNVDYQGEGKNTSKGIQNDNLQAERFQAFLNAAFQNYADLTKAGAGTYVFHASRTAAHFERALHTNGYEIRNQLIWNKPMAVLGWGDYRWKHEPFFYAGRKGKPIQFYGDRKHTTIWDFQKTDQQLLAWARRQKKLEAEGKTTIWSMKRDPTADYVHPTQKPVEIITYAILNSSKAGDLILDLFGGSGSTIIACEKTGRAGYSMEIDPIFCDVIVTRWQNFTGQTAMLQETGQAFGEVMASRQPAPAAAEA